MRAGALAVLFAPDSFKGSLTAVEVARALAEGWAAARPDDRLLLSPLADGGEGTLVAIEAAGGWEWRAVDVRGPLGESVRARWLLSGDGRRAALEMATASGLSLIPADRRDPVAASTLGTGQLILAALDAGVDALVLGIGGSATTDGGWGALEALGARADDDRAIDLGGLDPRLAGVDLAVACDVTNPLLGERGAAATYGPQKGATPDLVRLLDAKLGEYAGHLARAAGRDERETPGAGAAGGLGFGLLSIQDRFRSFALRPGIELVMEATDFAGKLAESDLVVTGEGRIDDQTAFGKTAQGVARRAAAASVPSIAVGGGVTPEGIEALRAFGTVVVPVIERPQSVEEAMSAGTEPLARCGERIARLLSLSSVRDLVHHRGLADTVNIQEARTHLSRLVERARRGERIVIAKAGKPVAELVGIADRPRRRTPGNDRIVIHPNFDDLLPEFDPDYGHPEDPLAGGRG